MKYSIVIEKTATGYSAYAPDLPGCVTTAPTIEAVKGSMREAIELHIEDLREDGMAVPPPASVVEYVEVAA